MKPQRSNHVRVIWNGQPLDCEYEYEAEERGDLYCPPSGELFGIIEALLPDGTDIIDTLSITETMKLNQLAIQELEKGREP